MVQPIKGFSIRTIRSPDQLERTWTFASEILDLPSRTGKHSLHYYMEQLANTPSLLVFAEQDHTVCGCVLGSIEEDHLLVGPVAVAEDSRRMGIGSAMIRELEAQARQLGQSTLILGAVEEAEPFYLSCGFQPNLFIQLPEPHSVARLRSLNERYEVVWQEEEGDCSKLMLRTPRIDKELQEKYAQVFPNCHTQCVFIKEI